MKKIITIIALIICAIATKAQVTLEHNYTNTSTSSISLSIVNLTNSGYKYALFGPTNQIRLYNMNHSLWKTFNFPTSPSGRRLHFPGTIISENLFNSDNIVEILYYTALTTSSSPDSAFVINENGNITFKMGDPTSIYPEIRNMGASTFKLIIKNGSGSSIKIYSLPGTLPCNPCNGTTGIVSQDIEESQMLSNPYPNPTNGRTTINYELPEGVNQGKLVFYTTTGEKVKEFTVDKTFKELQISNEDLSSGTYYYQMQTKNGVSEGKKLVIIK